MSLLQEYKCPCCGGAIAFDSGIQKMKCPFCDTEFEMEALAAYDSELASNQTDDMNWETAAGGEWQEGEADGLRSFVCKSCGGEIIGDENTAATSCPFCGNPVVMMGQFSGVLKPDYIIPFKLDKKAAKAALQKHYGGKRLLPKIFKDQNHIDEIKGVYVPFWLFDADADATIRYKATRVRTWSDSSYNYTETSFFAVSRGGKAKYALYPVWLLNTTWNGQKYTFAMNGQTGKLVGDLPVDKNAARRWTIGLTALCSAATYGIAWLLHFAGIL